MKIKVSILLLFSSFSMLAQEQLSLENMNDFRNQSGNWQIIGNVLANRNISVHPEPAPVSDKTSKRRKRKKRKSAPTLAAVQTEAGTGILYNNYSETQKDHLLTTWEHGDLKLALEVLIPNGSNSGIYLQGRYEVQLKDSWGVMNPTSSDIGGIHRNWETTPGKIFMGIPPLSNPTKAPGLWQKIAIHFQAPRFNDAGEKIANAKIISATLNGVLIHSNVEIPLPTGGPISNTEVATGPLMIQGDHGPIAFRNIKYQLLTNSKVALNELSYKTYKGDFKGLEDLEAAKVVKEGTAKNIDVHVTDEEDAYGITYSGSITIPEDDNYTFEIGYTGGASFAIDGKTIVSNNSSDSEGVLSKEITLNAGTHSFTITNIKTAAWRAPRLGFTISSAKTNPKSFHVVDSYPPNVNSVSPIYVSAEADPRMLRGFVSFKGNQQRLSHTIGVGTNEGLNFVYDLESANLVGVWRGNFVNATPMWHSRGNGSFNPDGAVQWTFLNQPLAQLEDLNAPFPATGTTPDFKPEGYSVDTIDGLPIFKHNYKGASITNKIYPNNNNTHLIHEINVSGTVDANWYYKIASGKAEKQADGSFTINDKEYYVNILSGQQPIVRELNGETELLVLADGSTIKYEIIW
ncbi:PA14 domain-containing protein [Arenibacter nanhaiticus]|uniref:PA14 domain-containing protein n=1 Tax=Arenibacter nanhaiticus TaxID=558155 RepID=A0A1M6B407_9FLAO|nr:family 16 glycoside hydrolase [Arenibacter nanhaiticus]SHI43479.1 PA14 domain-containing protein [Arenibacter nanhaiticus]